MPENADSRVLINKDMRNFYKGKYYLTTTNTFRNIEYFENPILSRCLIDEIKESKDYYGFDLFAFIINLEHFHMLIRSNDESISNIMKSIKKNSSQNINRILSHNQLSVPENPHSRDNKDSHSQDNKDSHSRDNKDSIDISLINQYEKQMNRWNRLSRLKNDFINKHSLMEYPKFKWHKSFHDRYARNKSDLMNKLNYIHRNPSKHGIAESWQNYPWSSLNSEFTNMIDKLP